MSKDYHIFTNFITTIAVIYYFSDKFYIANMGHIFYNDGNISQRRKLMTDKQAAAELEKVIIIIEQSETKEEALDKLRRIQELLTEKARTK